MMKQKISVRALLSVAKPSVQVAQRSSFWQVKDKQAS